MPVPANLVGSPSNWEMMSRKQRSSFAIPAQTALALWMCAASSFAAIPSSSHLDLAEFLGKPVASFLEHVEQPMVPEPDKALLGKAGPTKIPDPSIWKRVSGLLSWKSGNASIGQLLTARFRSDKDQIWYIQVPIRTGGRISFDVGPLKAGFDFNDCLRVLGEPERTVQFSPVIRLDWWTKGNLVFRTEHFSEDYSDIVERRRKGEVRWVAVYRSDLAPRGFDDDYSFYKAHSSD